MKKLSKILILSLLIIITLSTIIILSPKTNNINTYEYKINSNSMISMMLQNIEGNYVESDDLSWPTDDYKFNASLSKCTNGSKLKYNELENTINVETAKTDKCYAYFDNKNFIKDLSGSGNHGKNVGAKWSDEGLITGDETDFYGYVNCGLGNYNFGNDISLILRFKVNKITSEYNGYSFRNNVGGTGVGFSITSGSTLTGEITTDSPRNNSWIGNTKFNLNDWYTVVETYDGQIQKLYINGELSAEKNLTGNIIVSELPFIIGASPRDVDGANVMNYVYTTISNALIFDRALTVEEITKDYAGEINPTNKNDMLLWYKF